MIYPLFWDGIPPPNNEHTIGSQRPSQKKKNKKKKLGCPALLFLNHWVSLTDARFDDLDSRPNFVLALCLPMCGL